MDATTFRYLMSLAIKENLDSDIYMKLPERFKLPGAGSREQ